MRTAECWHLATSPMIGAFNFIEQCADVIVCSTRQRAAHIDSFHAEWRGDLHLFALCHSGTKVFIHNNLKWPAGSSGLCLQTGRHVVIKSEGGSHHHDANRKAS